MINVAIYSKTSLGRAELAERKMGINLRLRRALILIDGKTPFGELREMLATVGDPKELVEQLGELGLIESDYDLPPMPVFGNMLEPPTLMELHATR